MKRTATILGTLLLVTVASGQVRHAPDLSLDQLLSAAAAFSRVSGSESVWTGYAIERQMYADSHFGWYGSDADRPLLAEVLGGKTSAVSNALESVARRALAGLDDEQPLVTKEVGILLEVKANKGVISRVRLATMDAPARLGSNPILWAGSRSDQESLDFLEATWADAATELREDLITAIGAHDLRSRVLPFLAGVARSHGSEDEGEAARHWLADHLAVAMGLRPDTRSRQTSDDQVRRSALYALVQVEEGSANEMLVRLVTSSPDLEIRRLALIQLAHLDSRAGEAALLKMAQRYVRTGG